MGNSNSTSWVPSGIALAVAGGIGVAGALWAKGESYLPKAGPPPLRYQASRAANPPSLPPLPSEDSKPADRDHPEAAPVSLAPFRNPESTRLPAELFPSGLWLSQLAAPGSRLGSPGVPESIEEMSHVAASATASDLLGVSPEMLIDYFKPVPAGPASTNAPPAVIVVPVQFMPATPPASPGSTATYHAP